MHPALDRRRFLRFGTVALGGLGLPGLVPGGEPRRARALARRLVEAGARFITVYWGKAYTSHRG
jgi:hypothetical protein